ncbi:MAG: DNA-3-methyladenine glycosylase 2 family protein [Verrucomicrobiota bacterium]
MIPTYWTEATEHLSRQCATMAALIAEYPLETLTGRGDAFYTLLRSIVGQQISVKAADTVWGRLEAKVKPLVPAKVARARDTTLRAAGLSGQKVSYCKNLARFFLEHLPDDGISDYWVSLSDEAIVKQLTTIKGIGVWTVEMFLIFHLQRPDVYPLQDIAMIKAIEKYYAEGQKLSKPELIALGERWRPFRSVSTWYLWRSLDPVPVVY